MKFYTNTVSPELLNLLQQLMDEKALQSFALARGTALALRLAHRTSIDLDLFTCKAFDAPATAELLKTG